MDRRYLRVAALIALCVLVAGAIVVVFASVMETLSRLLERLIEEGWEPPKVWKKDQQPLISAALIAAAVGYAFLLAKSRKEKEPPRLGGEPGSLCSNQSSSPSVFYP